MSNQKQPFDQCLSKVFPVSRNVLCPGGLIASVYYSLGLSRKCLPFLPGRIFNGLMISKMTEWTLMLIMEIAFGEIRVYNGLTLTHFCRRCVRLCV